MLSNAHQGLFGFRMLTLPAGLKKDDSTLLESVIEPWMCHSLLISQVHQVVG